MKKIQIIIRLIAGLVLAYIVFKETGIFTAIFCLLVLIESELNGIIIIRLIKEIEKIKNNL